MNNGNSNDRLDRIENILDRLIVGLEETKAIANSNSCAIQAMMEQQVTDRLRHEEAMTQMRDLMSRMAENQSGLTKILTKIN